MDVNFDNLRIQAMISYDNVCTALNDCIDEDGLIRIHARELQKDMDLLRQHIGVISCVFKEGEKYFSVVRDKVVMADFNPDEK